METISTIAATVVENDDASARPITLYFSYSKIQSIKFAAIESIPEIRGVLPSFTA